MLAPKGFGLSIKKKWNRALRLLFRNQCSDYGATTVSKVSLYSTITRAIAGLACSPFVLTEHISSICDHDN